MRSPAPAHSGLIGIHKAKLLKTTIMNLAHKFHDPHDKLSRLTRYIQTLNLNAEYQELSKHGKHLLHSAVCEMRAIDSNGNKQCAIGNIQYAIGNTRLYTALGGIGGTVCVLNGKLYFEIEHSTCLFGHLNVIPVVSPCPSHPKQSISAYIYIYIYIHSFIYICIYIYHDYFVLFSTRADWARQAGKGSSHRKPKQIR